MQIIGRTGSLFTRVALIFAEEAGIDYELILLDDLIATDLGRYSGNPALRIPVLRMGDEVLFGTRNICRVLAARAAQPLNITWPEDSSDILLMNAQEIIRQSMMTQVQLLMMEDYGGSLEDDLFTSKAHAGLDASLRWLDENLDGITAALPPQRSFSLLEVELFCLVEHLLFAPTVAIEERLALCSFVQAFGVRESTCRTRFR
jgi:glutathione S-transferase